MSLLIYNIKELLQVRSEVHAPIAGERMRVLPTIKEAYLLIEDGLIVDFGSMSNCPEHRYREHVDAKGRIVLPTWCDSHTHIVYAGNREGEFVDRINGLTYEEIAHKGGGILNSAKHLQSISEEELYQQSKQRLEEVIRLGTGAIEIKSGYGLNPAAELKMLRVINRLKQEFPIPIKTTFLAAHALPAAYKNRKNEYIDMILSECLPIIADEGLADYIDVFCEKGYFSVSDSERIMIEGSKYGLKAKLHMNQFNALGGVASAVNHNALSVDHLEMLSDDDLEALKTGDTIPVALPTCSYFIGIPYTPARQIVDAGLPLAIASDFNPGSSPSGNMNVVVSTSCIKLKLTPEEAINAATINGAYAMELNDQVGAIQKGLKANLIMTKPINSYNYLPYSFGSNHIGTVYISGIPWSQ